MAPPLTVENLICNVVKYFEKERDHTRPLISPHKVKKRAADALGISPRKVYKALSDKKNAAVMDVVENIHQQVNNPEPKRCAWESKKLPFLMRFSIKTVVK